MIIPEDGLVFATDLEAWQAWLASRNRVRQLKTAVRERVSTRRRWILWWLAWAAACAGSVGGGFAFSPRCL